MFGSYDIIETIGQGGMGVVYRAHDTALDRIVALKVLREDLRGEDNLVARFQREAETFATLNHPNIVHIYSVGTVGSIPYIAMEYIEGLPLNKIMRRERKLDWERALRIVEQIISALGVAHDANIIHRDIKPGNILIDSDGKAYVTDFGIAKVLTAETKLTLEGSRLGTPEYMSPERCQDREITASSDIYSTGVMLFQLISGRLPYEAGTPVSLIRKIIVEPPSRLSEFVPDIPENVERLVAYMIEKKVRNRPQNCEEVLRCIARVRAGKSLDVGESGLAGAMASMRESGAAQRPREAGRQTWFARHWRRVPDWGRRTLAASAIVLAAGLAGWAASKPLTGEFAIRAARNTTSAPPMWERPAGVTLTVDDTPGVQITSVALRGFRVTDAYWDASGAAALLQLEGDGSIRWRGRHAVAAIDAGGMPGFILMPPVASTEDDWAPLSILAAPYGPGPAEAYLGAVLVRHIDPDSFGSVRDLLSMVYPAAEDPLAARVNLRIDGPWDMAPDRYTEAAFSLSEARVAVAAEFTGSKWALYEGELSDGGRLTLVEIASSVEPLHDLAYRPDGAQIAYLRGAEPANRSLWLVDAGGTRRDGVKLADGVRSLSAFPFDGGGILAAASGEDEMEIVVRVDAEIPESVTELGEGVAALRHPSWDFIVALAPDRRGLLQLWRLDPQAPFDRIQLTFRESGLREPVRVSPDGQRILATVGDEGYPSVAVVTLSELNY